MVRTLFGLLLIGHAAIHFGYLSPAPPRTAGGPEWPFEMSKSWLVTNAGLSNDVVRIIGMVLVVVVVLSLVAGGLATLGLLVPREWWPVLVGVGAVASLLTLAIFFHPWLVVGFAIDAVLLWLVLAARWSPFEPVTLP